MVNKIWRLEVARAWLQAKPEPPHARSFTEPQWQNHVATWYMTYRCMILVAWIMIIICSIFELGCYEPLGKNHKWPIYLTNWDLLLGSIQASLGLLLVFKRWKLQTQPDFDPNNLTLGKAEKIYWFLYTTTCSLAINVTVMYWVAVHDPKIHHVDPLNIMIHVCNSLLMMIDFAIMNVPLKMRHFWWCLTIATGYITFTLIYYYAGGTDKYGSTYIYKVLDWQNPRIALFVYLGGSLFVVIIHCLLCLFTRFKEHFAAQCNREPCSSSV